MNKERTDKIFRKREETVGEYVSPTIEVLSVPEEIERNQLAVVYSSGG